MYNPLTLFSHRSQRRKLYPILSVLVAIGLCIGSPQPGYGISWFDLLRQGVQVVQLSNVSTQQEVQIGEQINQQLLGSQVRLNRNPGINRYINQIGQRLADRSARPGLPYTFQVVEDNSINAFATMGGFVYVNTGTIKAADNEAQLAGVIAHEIGHIDGRHALNQMRQTALARGLASAAGLNTNTAVQIGVELAIRKPKSRKDEFDADQRGLAMLKAAGYAPSGMSNFMQKLLNSSAIPAFLSDHPATSDRITALDRNVDPKTANVGDGLDSATYRSQIRSLLR